MQSKQIYTHYIFQLILILFIGLTSSFQIKGQSYKKMTPEVYSQWNKISSTQISDHANTVIYNLEKETGDKILAINLTANDSTLFIKRIKQSFLDPSGKYIIYTHTLAYDSLQTLKRKKTPKDKLPKDSLTVFNIQNFKKTTFANIEKIYFPSEFGDYVLFTKKHQNEVPDSVSIHVDKNTLLQSDSTKKETIHKLIPDSLKINEIKDDITLKDSINTESFQKILADSLKINKVKDSLPLVDSIKVHNLHKVITDSLKINTKNNTPIKSDTIKTDSPKEKPKGKSDNMDLYIYNFYTNKTDTIPYVLDFFLAEEAPELSYVQRYNDTSLYYKVCLYSLEGKATKIILDSMQDVTNLSMDKRGNRITFLGTSEKSKLKQPFYDLYLYTPRDTAAYKICPANDKTIPDNWVISKDQKLTFSESGKRLFFGIAPILSVQDTMLLENEIVNVEIWRYDTPKLYTEMEVEKEKNITKTYTVMYSLTDNFFMQLENEDTDVVLTSAKGDGRYALALRNTPYRKAVTWLGEAPSDFLLIDTEDNSTIAIAEKEYGRPQFSPTGKYLYWWNRNDSIWKTFDTDNKIMQVMGLWSLSQFFDEENDMPLKADPYGLKGWMSGDSIAIVYDRYDIWQLKPSDPFFSHKMTNGRAKKDVYRYITLNPKNDNIPADNNILVHVFNENTKADRYELLLVKKDSNIVLLNGPYKLSQRPIKAKESSQLLFTKESFEVFPDLLLTDTTFSEIKKISNANPQQQEYGWGHGELIHWTNYLGKINEGMIFYPPNYNPDTLYPMIVNFYEKSSNNLYSHRAPEAHRSTINYTYYTNNGYIIFNPDISYTSGQPGEDCVNAVESGVDYVVRQGNVDPARIGLQGHSWGGYQIAYLLTKSDRYRCAEAGAPVVNMVSAYGGIRWGSGMSRMFQYEKTQSRLGAALWEDPEMYHLNSPIYNMPKVKTPVLILHNDMDGAVPWYQGIEYFMALRRLNKPAWLLNYNQEPHWPVKWANRLDFNIRMEQFFNHYLKDKPMPLWMKEGNTPQEKGILNKY